MLVLVGFVLAGVLVCALLLVILLGLPVLWMRPSKRNDCRRFAAVVAAKWEDVLVGNHSFSYWQRDWTASCPLSRMVTWDSFGT